jgi:hypothetical protein
LAAFALCLALGQRTDTHMKPLTSDTESVDEDYSHIRVRGEDPDLDEAVEGVLEEIQQSLGGDRDEPLISFEELDGDVDELLDEEDDEQPTLIHAADPEDSQRITIPDVLAEAIVYAPVSDDDGFDAGFDAGPEADDEDEEPTRAFAAVPAIDEPVMDPPPSLRPISRTSLPPYRESSRQRGWLLAAALGAAAVVAMWTAWPKHDAVGARLSDSAVTMALAAQRSVATQGFQAVSKVADVRVNVDGKDRGLLPVALDDLSVGEHLLRFAAPGHASLERTIRVTPGQLLDLGSVELSVMAHRVYLNIEPTNAFAQIREIGETAGHRFAGPWPRYVDLDPARYEVTAFRAGFQPIARQFEIKPGGALASLRIELAHEDIYED